MSSEPQFWIFTKSYLQTTEAVTGITQRGTRLKGKARKAAKEKEKKRNPALPSSWATKTLLKRRNTPSP
jgi:hypothetical protein